jgi:hypothetical protein
MLRLVCAALASLTVFAASNAQADDLAKQMVDHFAGKWEYKRPDGDVIGSVDWKAVADGHAIAGPGTTLEGTTGVPLQAGSRKKRSGCTIGSPRTVHSAPGGDEVREGRLLRTSLQRRFEE